ncbi:GNAT family N-acetyltransferase [Antribacter sp. KLBMP9083]|uniref:GNAT family N-acetyltransferase n=1 Tax=Antribacter soli TaxID=2910976 RepID=A0AA41QCG2_9MICO|nr:N-acetyltransferase [Antribacter soli]MCF4119604.1 GNAT family N-acetyltransferase [Antribacter soli]
MAFFVRPYTPTDEVGWLRCRILSFLGTQYFDDVKTRRTTFDLPAVLLVAEAVAEAPVADGELPLTGSIAGILDIEVDGSHATIDTIAVHPDHARRGIASALLSAALPRIQGLGATELDAWTREDTAANAWYRRSGFTERFRYLHVYKGWEDAADGFAVPDGVGPLVTAFLHAPVEREAEMRARFARVHTCRQYVRPL